MGAAWRRQSQHWRSAIDVLNAVLSKWTKSKHHRFFLRSAEWRPHTQCRGEKDKVYVCVPRVDEHELLSIPISSESAHFTLGRRPRRMFRPCRLSQRAPLIRPAEKFSRPSFSWNTAEQVFGLYTRFLYHVPRGLDCMLGRAACLICSGHFPGHVTLSGADRPKAAPGTGLERPGTTRPVLCRWVDRVQRYATAWHGDL